VRPLRLPRDRSAGRAVADASIMPSIPRANTNLSTFAVAERLAERMLA
jgi:5-(hydroxymethyl)furfural/furfural oxidase